MASRATWRSAPHRFSPELPVTFSPFWLSPSLRPMGDMGQAGGLPSPSLLGEAKHEWLPQEGTWLPCQDPSGTVTARRLTIYCFTC